MTYAVSREVTIRSPTVSGPLPDRRLPDVLAGKVLRLLERFVRFTTYTYSFTSMCACGQARAAPLAWWAKVE